MSISEVMAIVPIYDEYTFTELPSGVVTCEISVRGMAPLRNLATGRYEPKRLAGVESRPARGTSDAVADFCGVVGEAVVAAYLRLPILQAPGAHSREPWHALEYATFGGRRVTIYTSGTTEPNYNLLFHFKPTLWQADFGVLVCPRPFNERGEGLVNCFTIDGFCTADEFTTNAVEKYMQEGRWGKPYMYPRELMHPARELRTWLRCASLRGE